MLSPICAPDRIRRFRRRRVRHRGAPRPVSAQNVACRFFYDARGSELFKKITRLSEYYPTRTETAILKAHAKAMAASVPDGGVLVEFGSGSSLKTELLLDRLPRLGVYVPVDVSQNALSHANRCLSERLPRLDIRPIVANFAYPAPLPTDLMPASRLLRVFRAALSSGEHLIVGIDIEKDARTLVRAHNDSAGAVIGAAHGNGSQWAFPLGPVGN